MSSLSPNEIPNTFYGVINVLETCNIPLENLIRRSLLEPGVVNSQYITKFLEDLPRLLGWLVHHETSREIVKEWMKKEYIRNLTSQLRDLTKPDRGFHFNAGSITADQMKECTIEGIAHGIETHAPDVWELVGSLLNADPALARHREKERERREKDRKVRNIRKQKNSSEPIDEDDEGSRDFWMVGENEDEPEDLEEQIETRRLKILRIKRVTCISIMMQATNQRANSMQALVGVFLQSCNVSEQTRNFLSHLGISVSVTTINRAIRNLSQEAYREIQRLGATFLTSYAYDNLDVDLAHSLPTTESSTTDTLVHLSTASMFPLHPITTRHDLDFSEQLRELTVKPPLPSTVTKLMTHLPPEYNQLDDQGKSIQDRFNSWKFLSDLITYGPPGFSVFKGKLGEPEEIECIPLTKTKQVPLRASKTGPSTPAKNATVMEEFFRQSNIGEATAMPTNNERHPINPGNTIIPVFGDLLTGQHIHSLQSSRIDDVSPVQRFQPQVYCHGWFHARMACVDAIWRRHIKDADTEKDPNSLMNYITQIRPLEKHKIRTNPTFRQLHEVVTHVGIVLRLDAWRVEVSRRHPEVPSLEKWVENNPEWNELCEIASHLAQTTVASPDMLSDYQKDDSQCDKSFETTRAYHKDFLLYEETNYSMNHGDIGRLDSCLVEWMYYFMGCGKTKYAQGVFHYLENMYINYPKPLANAIRMNSLVNPTGQKNHFRGIDWVIEHNNLYIKRIFGGFGSNHTVDRMVDASPLIEVYKDVRQQFEQMFCLTHKTSRHHPPKMKMTFAKLHRYMEKHQANQFIPGRRSEHVLMDTIQLGMVKLMASVDQERARLIRETKKQEQLRAEAEQSRTSFQSIQIRSQSQAKYTNNANPGSEVESETIAPPENPDEYDEENIEADRLEDDGSLFVDEVFE